MNNNFKMSLAKVDPETAVEQARLLLQTAKRQNGMIPNMYLFMANVPGLLSTYMHGYEMFRKESGFTPAEQEVVFLTISHENECAYCMAAHSVLADMKSNVPRDVTEAIRTGNVIADARLRALSEMARAMLVKQGKPDPEDVSQFISAGFTEKHILGIVLAIAVKTISNYSNHLFDMPLDAVFQAREWVLYRVANRALNFFKPKARS
jgi:uncharacterized peroxidase-related enzyme